MSRTKRLGSGTRSRPSASSACGSPHSPPAAQSPRGGLARRPPRARECSAFSSPGTPKRWVTPSASRQRTNRSDAFVIASSGFAVAPSWAIAPQGQLGRNRRVPRVEPEETRWLLTSGASRRNIFCARHDPCDRQVSVLAGMAGRTGHAIAAAFQCGDIGSVTTMDGRGRTSRIDEERAASMAALSF